MSFAVIFSGQGNQHAAMLPWLDDDATLRSMCARLDTTDWRASLTDPAWATSNATAQVLLTGTALAAWTQLARLLPAPACTAGYSVGELAAFSAAGMFDSEMALDLAVHRANAMDRCAERAPGAMLAIGGLTSAAIDELCARSGVFVAIRNGADSVVVGGPRTAIEEAKTSAASLGGRSTQLAVAVASHTPLMREAAHEFAQVLAAVTMGAPHSVLFSNAADRVHDDVEARQALASQIASPVRWDECMENIRSRSPSCVLEVGPGQALARMWNERYPEIPARSCDEFRSTAAIARWVVDSGER